MEKTGRNASKPIANGVVLMHELFAHICAIAGTVQVDLFGNDIVAHLQGGPNDKQALRLCYDANKVTIEFHAIGAFASSIDHERDAWCKLSMYLNGTGVSDLKLGKLLATSFFANHNDIVFLTSMSRNLMPYVILFYSWIEQLEKYHMWESEIEEAKKIDLHQMTELFRQQVLKTP